MSDGRVVIDAILDDRGVTKGAENIEKELSGIQSTASKLASGLAKASAVVGAAIGAAGLAVGKMGLEFNAMQEQSMVAWTTLLGSAKEAEDMLERISDMAKSTPFETQDVDIMAKYMHNAGLAGDELFKSLMRISDVSSAFAIPASEAREMARQMSQVIQAGVAYTEDLNILQDRGVPIYKAISDHLGVAVADVRKLASEGKITSDIYIAAFNNIAKGVEGASKAQSQTFNGMISTFKDNIKILAGELTEGLFNRVKDGFSNVLGLLESFTAGLQQGGLKGAFEAILPPSVFQRLQAFVTGFMNVFNTIKSFVAPILTEVGSFILGKISEIKTFWDENGAQIIGAVQNFFSIIAAIVNFFMPAIKLVVETVWGAIKNIVGGALDVIMGLVKIFTGIFTGDWSKLWEGIKQLFSGAIDFITGLMTLNFFGGIRNILTNLLKNGISIVKNLWTNIVNTFKNAGTNATNIVTNMVTRVVGFFGNLFTKAKNIFTMLRTFGASIWNALKEAVLGAARSIWQGVVSRFSSMASSVRNLMHNVRSAIINAWNQAVNYLKSINLKKVGQDIIRGLIRGITGMASAVVDAVQDIGKKITGGIKKVLGIRSPSKVMRDQVGRWIPAGIAEGIESGEKTALRAMSKLGSSLSTTIAPSVNVSNSLRGASLPINLAPAAVVASGGGYVQGRMTEGMLSTERFYSLVSAILEVAKRPVSVQVNGRELIYATVDDFDEVLKFQQNRRERFRRGG